MCMFNAAPGGCVHNSCEEGARIESNQPECVGLLRSSLYAGD